MRQTKLSVLEKTIALRRASLSEDAAIAPKNGGLRRSPRKKAILADMNERAELQNKPLRFASNF